MSYNDDRNAANERRGNDGSAAPDAQIRREIQEAKNYLELQELRKRVEEERKKEKDARYNGKRPKPSGNASSSLFLSF
ncbi:MAG: hypothetical protein IJO46_03765 [Thermoguttaceae bacterium]|nr:hypothetical protein [Thermoguttaceae bacterium]